MRASARGRKIECEISVLIGWVFKTSSASSSSMRSVLDDPQLHESYRASNRKITFRNCGRMLFYSVVQGFSVHDSPKRPTTGGLQGALQPKCTKLRCRQRGRHAAGGRLVRFFQPIASQESKSTSCRPKPHLWLSRIRPRSWATITSLSRLDLSW